MPLHNPCAAGPRQTRHRSVKAPSQTFVIANENKRLREWSSIMHKRTYMNDFTAAHNLLVEVM